MAGHHPRGDGLVLEELAGLDRLLHERGAAWNDCEMEDLRRRRQALLRSLPAPISSAYQSLADAGRMPAIADVTGGVCGGCGSPLPQFVIETLSHGAVAVCARCQRLLRASGSGR